MMLVKRAAMTLIVFSLSQAMAVGGVTLGISSDGRFFTFNGAPTFLNGVSYYGAQSITTPAFITQDLDDMTAQGFNWIRVWAFWKYPEDRSVPSLPVRGENVSVLTPDGAVREPYMSRLKALINECDKRGMVVDCTLDRRADSSIIPSNITQHLASVRRLATELRGLRNVYIDVANERDIHDVRFVSLAECGQLIDAIKEIDSQRLCTASGLPHSQSEMNDFHTVAKLDFLAAHLPRKAGCSAETVGIVTQYIAWMTASGFRMPIHLQEPFRLGFGRFQPTVDDFYRDASGAKVAEAAGWCLHNGNNGVGGKQRSRQPRRPYRSFLMSDSEGRLYTQYDPIEKIVSANLDDRIGGTNVQVRRYQAEYPEQIANQIGTREDASWTADVAKDAAGYLTSGPVIRTVPAGLHQVTWRLKVDNNQGGNDTVLTIDVVRGAENEVLASRQIRRRDFTASDTWQNFHVEFTSKQGDPLSFRTYWHHVTKVNADSITLTIDPATLRPMRVEKRSSGRIAPQ